MGRPIRLAEGVSLADLRPEMREVLIAADRIWREHGKELWVTSHKEGGHSPRSLHYTGFALDLRSRHFGRTEQGVAVRKLRQALGRNYDVIHEMNHFHVEYDPKPPEPEDIA